MHGKNLDNYQTQIEQLTNTILQTRRSLGVLSDRVLNIRALQMDEAFECTEEMDRTIAMMETYIIQYQQLLQDMIEKLLITKDIVCNSHNTFLYQPKTQISSQSN